MHLPRSHALWVTAHSILKRSVSIKEKGLPKKCTQLLSDLEAKGTNTHKPQNNRAVKQPVPRVQCTGFSSCSIRTPNSSDFGVLRHSTCTRIFTFESDFEAAIPSWNVMPKGNGNRIRLSTAGSNPQGQSSLELPGRRPDALG